MRKDIDAVISDYNKTLTDSYIEVPLGFAIMYNHWIQGNYKRVWNLFCNQFLMLYDVIDAAWDGYSRSPLELYGKLILAGEETAFVEDFPGEFIEWFEERGGLAQQSIKKLLRLMSSIVPEFVPDSMELFAELHRRGVKTGIYSTAPIDLIEKTLEHTGNIDNFDFIGGNRLKRDNGRIAGVDWHVHEHEKGERFAEFLETNRLDPERTVYIEDMHMGPLKYVRWPIAAPTAKKSFKEKCRNNRTTPNILVPSNWKEISEFLEI